MLCFGQFRFVIILAIYRKKLTSPKVLTTAIAAIKVPSVKVTAQGGKYQYSARETQLMKRIILASAAMMAMVLTAQFAAAQTFGPVTSGLGDGHTPPADPHRLYFGTGNLDESFVIGTSGPIELGLRAHVRFSNVTNYQGGGNYGDFDAGNFGTVIAPRASWNFDYSINTDVNGAGGTLAGALASGIHFLLLVDNDPSGGTNFVAVDPFLDVTTVNDNGYGTNSLKSTVVDPGNPGHPGEGSFAVFGATNNVAQNSENEGFNGWGTPGFDPTVSGDYEIRLEA
ncbi:MAG TPA: hypothetical protein VGJ04_05890, partial [Pirellulales bacterium]